jgi:hypothetical protein
MILTFLTSRFGMVAVVVAAAGIWIALLTFQLNSCKANNADLAIQATAMTGQIELQNAAVEALARSGKEKAAKAAQALSEAQKQAKTRAGEVARLKSLLKAPTASKTCKDAWSEIRK